MTGPLLFFCRRCDLRYLPTMAHVDDAPVFEFNVSEPEKKERSGVLDLSYWTYHIYTKTAAARIPPHFHGTDSTDMHVYVRYMKIRGIIPPGDLFAISNFSFHFLKKFRSIVLPGCRDQLVLFNVSAPQDRSFHPCSPLGPLPGAGQATRSKRNSSLLADSGGGPNRFVSFLCLCF